MLLSYGTFLFLRLIIPPPGKTTAKKEPPGGGSFLHFPVDTGVDIRYRYR